MNTSGEAAEQVMRMSLEGAEILIKLTGSGAKNAAVLLYSIYKEQNKTRGKERLTNMLRSGKPLKVYTFKRDNLEKFKEVAKEYGILYTVLKEKEDMCNKPALLWASGLRCGRANRDGGISAGVYLPFGRGVSGGQAGTHGRRDALVEHCRQLCRKRKGNMERGNGENGQQK